MKVCKKCLESKDLPEFNKQAKNEDGYQNWCRNCTNSYNNKYYLKNKEKWENYSDKKSKIKERVCIICDKVFRGTSRRCDFCVNEVFCDVCCKQILSPAKRCINCFNRTRIGPLNPVWKGGKSKHKKGYVLKKCPEHPRSGSGGYVFEHILIMEEYLGRYVVEPETVHHKNGIKDDNRLENLELWSRIHPSGQRVSDMIKFCLEYLDKYGEDPSKYL